MKLIAPLRFALMLMGLVAASEANAVCSSPAGIAGDIAYSSNINAPVYCDGTSWTSMSGGGGTGGGTANPAGTTNDVQFNSAGSLAADTGQFTYAAGLLRAPTISATTLNGQYASLTTISNPGSFSGNTMAANSVSASYVSSTITQVSGTILACTSALKGSIRYSNTSNTLEYCNSTAWISAGPSGTVVPSFAVNRNGANQTVTASTETLMIWTNKATDTNNNFDLGTGRFTPTIPGKYLIHFSINCTTPSGYCLARINKNSTIIATAGDTSSASDKLVNASALVDMNGTTDYVLAQVYTQGTNINGTTAYTHFSGTLISMAGGGGGGSGGTAAPAGISGSIQFNSAGALAGRSDIIIDPSGSVGIGTGKPRAALDVSGTVKMAGTGAEVCVSNTLGTFRFNPINGVPQICR